MHFEEGLQIGYEDMHSKIDDLNLTALSNESDWSYKPTCKKCIEINGDYTQDMELYYTVEEMRQLYRWESGMEYLAICELASGDFPECHRDKFKDKLEEFKICVEAKLSMLNCFNYLSEDEEARKILYKVCRFNRSEHFLNVTN